MRIPFYKPTPAPPGVFQHEPFPMQKANFLSKFFVHYVTPMMKVGASRPLEAEDLWSLTPELRCEEIADRLEANLMARMPPSRRAQKYKPSSLAPIVEEIEDDPGTATEMTHLLQKPIPKVNRSTSRKLASGEMAFEDGHLCDMSLWKAILKTTGRAWLSATTVLIIAQLFQVLSPLFTKRILLQMRRAYLWRQVQDGVSVPENFVPPESITYCITLVIGLFAMLFMRNMLLMQGRTQASIMGNTLRAAVVDLISRKSTRLSASAKVEMSSGRVVTLVTSDSAYLEWAYPNSAELPSIPVMVIIATVLLIRTLGLAALVGIGALVVASPLQGWLFKRLMYHRRKQNQEVDLRVRFLHEVIRGIRPVKLSALTQTFGSKIETMRQNEHDRLYVYSRFRASVNALLSITPYLSSILTFITYALLGHELDPVIIFTSLQLFDIIRLPLQAAPIYLAQLTDCFSGVRRIGEMFRADEVASINIERGALISVQVKGDFEYDVIAGVNSDKAGRSVSGQSGQSTLDGQAAEEPAIRPFSLRDIDLQIPQGSLVCVVGRVGSGKTSLLCGMINELRRRGTVTFSGRVSYVPQSAWLQSASLIDNILFGSDDKNADMERVNEVIDACGLRHDVDNWHDGEFTQIGEGGITLSGGQRQRVCIARAAYEESDICLLDDPLSALDAHVGDHLMQNAILQGPLSCRTRILVTHQLDIMHHADIVLVVDRDNHNVGRIVQQGSYETLMSQEGVFKQLVQEFGNRKSPSSGSSLVDSVEEDAENTNSADEAHGNAKDTAVAGPKAKGHIVEKEERNTGAVSSKTYMQYAKAVNSPTMMIMVAAALILAQICAVSNTVFLGMWSSESIEGFATWQYMAVYGGLGIGIVVFMWISIYVTLLASLRASFTLFNEAWLHVVRAPISWHDATPTGRIVSRLSKDIQMADEKLGQYLVGLARQILTVFGVVLLIKYSYPTMVFIFVPLFLYFWLCSSYYRKTSREVKRIESVLRSAVYTSFAEQLAGSAVIRAFSQERVFQSRLANAINSQYRATILNVVIQRWLGVRVEFASQLVVLIIGICGVIYRDQIDAARFGVLLTMSISAVSVLTEIIPNAALVEQEMNAVERVQHYCELPMEADPVLPHDPIESEWPIGGEVQFRDLEMRYRPDLPLTLKGVSFTIKPGEKVGIVGRTGAGKSSIAQALFRAVEPCGGTISVDGVDLRTLGLDTLRSRLAIIPQDSFLFNGTIRDNLDPEGKHTDAQLNDVLNLIHRDSTSHSLREKFQLDARILPEGSNLSQGEKQLLALVRALVRNNRVLLLDEATSAVDPETDALIQRIIQGELANATLISIAHRLSTIAYYDRVLCLDDGRVVEYDTPLNLFDKHDSLFRGLCDKKHMSREDIVRLQAEAAAVQSRTDRTTLRQLIDKRPPHSI